MSDKRSLKRPNFVAANEKAKSEVVVQFVRIARKARLSYDEFLYISQQARKKLGLHRPKKERRLPQLLPEAALKRFFQIIQDCGDVQHEILLKLQANLKTLEEGANHPDRDRQFQYLNRHVRRFLRRGDPVISVDTKKKELMGRYFNKGRQWRPQGKPEKVNIYDFIDPDEPKAIPYGI